MQTIRNAVAGRRIRVVVPAILIATSLLLAGRLLAAEPTTDSKPVATTETKSADSADSQRKQEAVGQNEELSFQQAKVAEEMAELEERMFRLSEALKAMEPANASRLMLGLKYAREELILHQMKETQEALKQFKLGDASADQQKLLAKLARLEQLLMSADLDFQMRLERLRLIREIVRRLDVAIKEETREQQLSEGAAKVEAQLDALRKQTASLAELIERQTTHIADSEKALAATSGAPAVPAEKQKQTRDDTKALPDPSELLQTAGSKMDQAVDALEQKKVDTALPTQREALDHLKRELARLADEERKLEAELSAEKFAALRKEQSQTRQSTADINDLVRKLGDTGASALGELIRADAAMNGAEDQLGNRRPVPAGDQQGQALASLKYAREQLAQEAEDLLNELRGEVKKRVMEGLVEMLERQVIVRETTIVLAPRLSGGSRQAMTAVTALAKSEQKIIDTGDLLVSMVEEVEFGIALPAALRMVLEQAADVRNRLAAGDASKEVVEGEQQIEEDIKSLLDAMKRLPSRSSSGPPQPGNMAERERELNRLVAELKMVRMLQHRVNRDTKSVDTQRPAELEALSGMLRQKIQSLHDRQEDVHDTTERLSIERGAELQ